MQRFYLALQSALSSFWFLPFILSFSAVVLFVATVSLDRSISFSGLEQYGPPFSIGPQGARQLTATIAGSLITVATLVFSMTLVALTVAAGNIGARLLSRYMRNRTIQITLGLFLSGFIYALLTLSAIAEDPTIVPRISIVVAMVFAIASFIWLAYAFHDLAETIRVDHAIARLSSSLETSIRKLKAREKTSSSPRQSSLKKTSNAPAIIRAGENGYVQSIDTDHLLDCASKNDFVADIRVKPGAFILEGEALIHVYTQREGMHIAEPIQQSLSKSILIAGARTDLDDPLFCLRLINEIATRALSPGVNDLYTAMACIDHLAGGVRHLLTFNLSNGQLHDNDGVLRVQMKVYDFEAFLHMAFDDLRRLTAPHPALAARLIERLGRLVTLADNHEERQIMLSFIDAVFSQASCCASAEADKALLKKAHDAASSKRDSIGSPLQQEN